MLVFAAALPGDELRGDYAAMRRVAALPALVDAGLMAATLSSALASFLGAPRILQALAATACSRCWRPSRAATGRAATRAGACSWPGQSRWRRSSRAT